MSSRMDRYKNEHADIPTRSNKNKALYTQIYNAYDEFENLIVPSNAKEITITELKKEIIRKDDAVDEIHEPVDTKPTPSKEKEDLEVYDINELINKAVSLKTEDEVPDEAISNGSYLKKLKLDNRKTNIEQVKEMYEDIKEETLDEDESLLKTANLSLEILSDLKSDNDITKVSAPIKEEEMPTDSEISFYSDNYKFSKKDFEKSEEDVEEDDDEEEEDDEEEDGGNGKFFFKILLLIIGLMMIIGMLIYFINYFNRV